MIGVEVFGIRDELPPSKCSCGGTCGGSASNKTMGEMYEELKRFLVQSDLGAEVQVQFLDVLDDDLSGHDAAHMMFKNGLALPLVAVKGIVLFSGGINTTMVYDEVKKALG
ncbi:MAG: hypothetical protein P4L49_08220 [Desulfosporosinus sp.]|nr:hypothetical protein [Desulfosporosinus sp.]